MIESKLAKQWAAMHDFPNRMASWTWFKSAVSNCLLLTAQKLDLRCELRNGDLAEAFFHWAGYADCSQDFAKLDPVDYAHYACGILLRSLILAHPISVIDKPVPAQAVGTSMPHVLNWPEDVVLLCLTLTLLESWRLHLGAPPLVVDLDLIQSHWDSFHENAREDSFSPVAFLDLFLGLPPVWANAMTAGNRPAMRQAHQKSQSVHSGHAQSA